MLNFRRIALTVLVFFMVASAAQSAFAQRSIRVDLGDSNFDQNGEAWFYRYEVDFATEPLTTGSMPFALNYSGAPGPGTFQDFGMSGYPLSPPYLGLAHTDLTGTQSAGILAYYFDSWPPYTSWDSGEWSIGMIDTQAPYSKSEAVDAIRFTWKGSISDGRTITTQVVLLNRGAGDFDIELNYGLGTFDFPAGGSQLMNFMPNGPGQQLFASHGKIGFVGACFRGGVGEICAPVPEPSTYALFVVGVALLGGIALRRRAIGVAPNGVPG